MDMTGGAFIIIGTLGVIALAVRFIVIPWVDRQIEREFGAWPGDSGSDL